MGPDFLKKNSEKQLCSIIREMKIDELHSSICISVTFINKCDAPCKFNMWKIEFLTLSHLSPLCSNLICLTAINISRIIFQARPHWSGLYGIISTM